MMRIAMFMPNMGPSALGWRVHLDFAAAVEHLGHRFSLLTTSPPEPATGSSKGPGDADGTNGSGPPRSDRSGSTTPDSRLPGDPGVRVLPVAAGWQRFGSMAAPLLRNSWLPAAAAALRRYLRENGTDFDLLHLEVAYPHGAAGAVAAAGAGWKGPIGLTPMGEDVLVIPGAEYGFRRFAVPRALVAWTLRRATCVRCISPLFADHIQRVAPRTRRRVIPLNISSATAALADEPPERRRTRRLEARAAFDAEHDTAGRPLVLSFGRLHPFKGVEVLVDAMTRVPDAMLVIVGPSLTVRRLGDTATGLVELIDDLGLADRVRYVGAVSHERSIDTLAAADVVAVPSHLESLNKVCVEAAAVGTPFVVTETTGISAWTPNSGAGLVVPPANPAALAWALAEILEGHWQPDPNARLRFVQRFHPERIAAEVLTFYEEILSGANGT